MLTAWIMSIVGVVVMGVLLDTILPEGNMQKYIRSIFALIVVFVIVAPLPKLAGKDFNFQIPSNAPSTEIDNNFIENIYKSKVALLEKSVENDLNTAGWQNVDVKIYVDIYNENMKITSVMLNLKKLVIDKNMAHILSYEEVQDKVSKQLKIHKGLITKI